MKKLLLTAAAIAFASPAMAATDGVLSETSSEGTLEVTVDIPKMVRISGLDDINIDVSPANIVDGGNNHITGSSEFCVYSNNGQDGAYSISVDASTSGVSGRPYLLAGAAENLNYTIYLGELGGGDEFQYQFPSNVETFDSNSDGNGRRTTLDCSDRGDNAIIRARVWEDDVIAAQAGIYTDTITVTVAVV